MTKSKAAPRKAKNPKEEDLAVLLKRQVKDSLVDLLIRAYNGMSATQRRDIFGELIEANKPKEVGAENLWRAIQIFDKESRSGTYYSPFDVNSKNYSDIPEETEKWCSLMAEFLTDTVKICQHGDHEVAVKAFTVLFKLIDDMGDEIIFADEVGSWMISVDDKLWLKAYLTSLAAICSTEEYATKVIPLLTYDAMNSNCGEAYASALKVGNKDQVKKLREEILTRKIRVKA